MKRAVGLHCWHRRYDKVGYDLKNDLEEARTNGWQNLRPRDFQWRLLNLLLGLRVGSGTRLEFAAPLTLPWWNFDADAVCDTISPTMYLQKQSTCDHNIYNISPEHLWILFTINYSYFISLTLLHSTTLPLIFKNILCFSPTQTYAMVIP